MSALAAVLARLRALDPQFNPAQIAATRDIYAPLVEMPDPQVCTVHRDLAYGPDARHRLDVFTPVAAATALRTVFVYVHGGGFVQGDKGAADAPFYNNVGVWAARQGYVGVNLTYRLAPAHGWPAGSADLDRAINWLIDVIADYGGDPARIVLCGQSAGAVHVAGYLAGHGRGSDAPPPLAAAVLLSGIYDLTLMQDSPLHHAYYGTDRSHDVARSTLPALAATSVPCLFSVCENDPPEFQLQAARVVQARVAQRGVWPPYLYQLGHNHVSGVMQLGSAVDTLGPQLAQFIAVGPGLPA